jgi:hypothetical protein
MSAAAMTTPTDASAKKPYARHMTEKRKEQNRRSQKIYREKLKKKLEELEDRVQETQAKPKQSSSPVEAVVSEIPKHASLSPSPIPVSIPTSTSKSNIIDFNAAFAAAGDLVLPTDSTLPTFELGFRDRPNPSSTSSPIPTPEESKAADESPVPIFLAAEVYMPADPDSEDMRLMWPLPPAIWGEFYTPPTARERRIPLQSSTFPRSFSSSSRDNASFSPFSRTPTSHNTPTGIPSPYLNHLRLLGETAFTATLSIAATLGITRSAYVNDHPSPLGPSHTRQSSTSYHIPSIPKDLRPTPPQLTLIHPSYLDCIPFPHFRSAAIVLSSRGELNHAALFLDLMHDGLVCWGGAAGGNMRDGVAWSKRSWEARPWFLRRWGWLLAVDTSVQGVGLRGGEGVVVDEERDDRDGMFEGARWWRNMRGEEEEEDDGEEKGEEHGEMLSRHVTCNIGVRDVQEFAGNGTLWPTQFGDPMAMKLDSMGLSAPRAMELGLSQWDPSTGQAGRRGAGRAFGFSLY